MFFWNNLELIIIGVSIIVTIILVLMSVIDFYIIQPIKNKKRKNEI